jgi:hypothetical protein
LHSTYLTANLATMLRHDRARVTPYLLQEQVQLRVGGGVLGDLEQGGEDVVQHLLERLDDALLLVHRVQPRDLEVTGSKGS